MIDDQPTGDPAPDERFKFSLPFHPAFRWTMPVPLALLHHYRPLGLRHQHLVFVLEIFSTYLNGDEASQSQIAEWMQTDPRVLRQYISYLEEIDLLTLSKRYDERGQAENDYDFTPLLDAALLLYEQEEQARRARAAEIANLLQEIGAAIENGYEIGESLKRRLLALYHESRAAAPTPAYPDDEEGDGDTHSNGNGNGRPSLISRLGYLGIDRRSASYLVHKARETFGDDMEAVIAGWLAEIKAKEKQIRNPAGFLRSKLEAGVYPPQLLGQTGVCAGCGRILNEGETTINGRCLDCTDLPIKH